MRASCQPRPTVGATRRRPAPTLAGWADGSPLLVAVVAAGCGGDDAPGRPRAGGGGGSPLWGAGGAAGCGGEDAPGRPTNATADRAAATPPLVERLRRGGYVLALRHAATDQSMADNTRDLRDCSKQRNLSAAGRRQAQAIGRALRRLRIPVGTVLASPYCRTRATARLA